MRNTTACASLLFLVVILSSCGKASTRNDSPTINGIFSPGRTKSLKNFKINQSNIDFYYLAGYRDALAYEPKDDKRLFYQFAPDELAESYFRGYSDGAKRAKGISDRTPQ